MKSFTSSAFFLALGAVCGALGCSSDDSGAGEASGGSGGNGGNGGSAGGGPGGGAGQAGETSTTQAPDLEDETYAGDDPRIRYTGRVDFSVPETPRFSLPGTTVSVRFKGTGISVHLTDQFKYGTERNFYDAMIDGERFTIIGPEIGVTDYQVARDLEYGEHTLVLAKRTQASLGYGIFQGVTVTGELLEPPAESGRRMIF